MPRPLATITAAPIISGHGQGGPIGVPTLNINPMEVPSTFGHGIYACRVLIDGKEYSGALHFGPRPAFHDQNVSCEVHVLDTVIDTPPDTIDVTIVKKIRNVEDFPNVEAMKARIEQDIEEIRDMLRHS